MLEAHEVVAAKIRAQIDLMDARVSSLLKACEATLQFHTTGPDVGIDDLEEWAELTGGLPMTSVGLVAFVRAQIEGAK